MLSPELNGAQMYILYKQYCQENDISNPVKEHKYRYIFRSDFRLKCFCPKKDQCPVCNAYCAAMGDEKEMRRESWEEHTSREKEAMVEKVVDKDRAKADDSYHSVTFDLQAVLTTPYILQEMHRFTTSGSFQYIILQSTITAQPMTIVTYGMKLKEI